MEDIHCWTQLVPDSFSWTCFRWSQCVSYMLKKHVSYMLKKCVSYMLRHVSYKLRCVGYLLRRVSYKLRCWAISSSCNAQILATAA